MPPRAHAASELDEHGAERERAERKRRQDVPFAQSRNEGAYPGHGAEDDRRGEGFRNGVERRTPPCDERPDAHQEDECERERRIDLVEEWRTDRNFYATHSL